MNALTFKELQFKNILQAVSLGQQRHYNICPHKIRNTSNFNLPSYRASLEESLHTKGFALQEAASPLT